MIFRRISSFSQYDVLVHRDLRRVRIGRVQNEMRRGWCAYDRRGDLVAIARTRRDASQALERHYYANGSR